MESLQALRTPALGGESAVTDEETNRSSVLTTALKFPVVLFTHSAYRTLSKLLIRAVSLKTTGSFPVTDEQMREISDLAGTQLGKVLELISFSLSPTNSTCSHV